MANKTKKRIFYFDELRALAILCVILCHTSNIYEHHTFTSIKVAIPGVLYILTHIAVPIFFMLSGALLLNRKYDLREFFKKRFSRILYPFIFWVIVAIVVSLFVLHSGMGDAYKIFVGKNRWTWFVWVMIGVYLILPVVNSFIREYGLKGAEYFLAVWFVTIILQTIGKYPFHRLEISYFAGYVGYVVLGYYLANKDFKLSDRKMIILGALLFVVFILVDLFVYAKNIPNIETKYLSLFIVLASIGVFLMFRYYNHYCEANTTSKLSKLHQKIEKGKVGAIIFSLSACSYGMYLLNSLLVKFVKFFDLSSVKWIPVLFVVVTLLSWLIVKIVSKIPFLGKFSGAA